MAQPPPNPKPRRLTPCHRHPDLATTTGLCAPCLRERLSLLNPSSCEASTSTSSSSTSAAPLPELRRCKTFSAKNCDVVLGVEPRRRSCDVRGRNSLSSLFDIDDDDEDGDVVSVQSRNLGFLSKKGATCPVPEEVDEEEIDVAVEITEARVSDLGNVDEFEESMPMKDLIDLELQTKDSSKTSNGGSSSKKDFKEIAGSFWVAASVFSKKFRKWGKKQKRENERGGGNGNGGNVGEMKLENLRGRRLRDTQSEVGEYGFGRRSCDTDPRGSIDFGRASIDCGGFGRSCDTDPRGSIDCGGFGRRSCDTDPRGSIDCGGFGRRSCDTDPRFSIDLGRASVDCGRISVDEAGRGEYDAPRASWDGYMLGGRSALSRGNGNMNGNCNGNVNGNGNAPMVSVIENAMATVYGFDNRVLGEGKMKMENGRNGFDRCSSVKRDVGVIEDGEGKGLSNARVSPAAIGIFNGTKLLITEKELNEWRLNSNSVRDDSSESFETASKDLASVSSSSNGKGFKKCRQWSKLWSIWGLLHRRKGGKFGDEEGGGDSVVSPDADSVDNSGRRLGRSHSTSSSRGSSTLVSSAGVTMNRNESKAIVKSRQDAVVLQRNRSARYSNSPNQLDNNGLLRLYLTPLRSRRRNRLGKSRLKNSKSLAKSVLRL